MNEAEKIAPDYSRHEPSDAAWSAACVAYATTVGRAKLAEAIRAAYEVDDVRPAAITAAVEAEREAIAATHDAEIARLQKQIEENNAYMARVSNMTPENTLAGESRANKFCRDQLRWHERFAASIRARKGEASNGNVG